MNAAVAWLSTGVLGLATIALLAAGIWLWAAFALVVALWGTPLFRRPARVLTDSVGALLR